MFQFHADRDRYFAMQVSNASTYVIPFIQQTKPIQPGMHVLEIGCGEAGVLKAFIQLGCTAVGIELEEGRLANGRKHMYQDIADGKLTLIANDIYNIKDEFIQAFDIIVLKDVIEHIHDQKKLIAWMKDLLKPDGVIFFGFPPWYMPWGGHQQVCHTKWVATIPWLHLLPNFIYKSILQANNEAVAELLEIKETGISIERFESICKHTGYTIANSKHYLINPIYQFKFGWKPRTQFWFISKIPFVRNFFTTCVYYTIQSR